MSSVKKSDAQNQYQVTRTLIAGSTQKSSEKTPSTPSVVNKPLQETCINSFKNLRDSGKYVHYKYQ